MENKTYSLDIEIDQDTDTTEQFYFTTDMLCAVASGLSAIYNEVFIWRTSNHLAIWVVGQSPELLIRAFDYHKEYYTKVQLLQTDKAITHFTQVLKNNYWHNCSLTLKFETFMEAYKLSLDLQSLGTVLKPLVKDGLYFFYRAPLLTAAKNSWRYQWLPKEKGNIPYVRITAKDLFYRFCIN